jgi:hypothetical protein
MSDSPVDSFSKSTTFAWFRRLSIAGIIIASLGGVTWKLAEGVTAARAAARKSSCDCRLKQIGLGLQNFADVHKQFPAAHAMREGKPGMSWRVQILPYIEQRELYDRYREEEAWDSPFNRRLADEAAAKHPSFRCPAAPAAQPLVLANYVMPVGPGTISDGPSAATFANIRDGSSHTIAVTEIFPTDIGWTEPRDLSADKMGYQVNNPLEPGISSMHPSCASALFADGHTQTLSNSIDPSVLKALLTIAGGEKIQQDY